MKKTQISYWKEFKKFMWELYLLIMNIISAVILIGIFVQGILFIWEPTNVVHIKWVLTNVVLLVAVLFVSHVIEGDQ